VRASLLMMLAQTPASPQQQQAWLSEARQELDQALASNPHLAGEWSLPLAAR
jgi:hypothetical protein